jgi:hypothetical protein
MIVVEEVGPEQRAAGEASSAAGAREVLAEGPADRWRKRRFGPARRAWHPFGHPIDNDEFGRRSR